MVQSYLQNQINPCDIAVVDYPAWLTQGIGVLNTCVALDLEAAHG